METSKVEEEIYSVLTTDEKLTEKIKEIYHIQAPAKDWTKYPCIVYTPISDVPNFFADNKVLAHRLSIRFHIITLDGEYTEIADDLQRLMLGFGAKRYQSIPYADNKEKILIVDYRMLINKTESEPENIYKPIEEKECCKCSETSKIKLITNEEIDQFFDDLEKEGKFNEI